MMGRFINGDDRLVDNDNMFAYCENNPVMNVDPTGTYTNMIDSYGYGWSDEYWVLPLDLVIEEPVGYEYMDDDLYLPQSNYGNGWSEETYTPLSLLDELKYILKDNGISTFSSGNQFSINIGLVQGSITWGWSYDLKGNMTPFITTATDPSVGTIGIGFNAVYIFTDAETVDDLKREGIAAGGSGSFKNISLGGELGRTIDDEGKLKYNTKSLLCGVGIGGAAEGHYEDSYTWNLFNFSNK